MSEHKEDEYEYEDLEELRQEVRLTTSKLLDLTYNDSKPRFIQLSTPKN